ncbi:TPA: hypothetical protein OZO41_003260 [Escherichia coli]|nr:hypothetical protein [Escherichia coli]
MTGRTGNGGNKVWRFNTGAWTASANLRGRLYLHRGIERTYTRDLLVEVFLDGRGNGLNH